MNCGHVAPLAQNNVITVGRASREMRLTSIPF
jgi:hypothetical protein